MAETIVATKHCPRCGLTKPTAEFYRNRSKEDGLQSECKPCWAARVRAYGQTDAGHRAKKKSDENARKSAKRKAWVAAYERSDYGRQKRLAQVRRYQATDKGKASMKRADQKRKDTNEVKARAKVRDYVARGRMPAARELSCRFCGQAAVQFHHIFGYEREHWLDVVPLCKPCHQKSDKTIIPC